MSKMSIFPRFFFFSKENGVGRQEKGGHESVLQASADDILCRDRKVKKNFKDGKI